MPNNSRHGGRPVLPDSGGLAELSIGRASVLLVVFVAVTVAMLGGVRPGSNLSSGVAPTPSTTSPSATPSVATSRLPAATTGSTTTTTTTPPSAVPVVVANGTHVPGLAAKISDELKGSGWDLLPPLNASSSVTRTAVYYLSGRQSAAVAIATSLHLSASAVAPYTAAVAVAAVGSAQVVVVAGPDVAGGTAAAPTTVPPTTVAPSTVATSKHS